MYKVSIYNKSNKQVAVYERIHTIIYNDFIGENVITGDNMLTHHFPTNFNYHLLSDSGNYSIDESVIGTLEISKVVY